MIEIEGSYGEGGGSILRYSVALSIVSGEPIRVFNIRARRRPPGLKAQHLTAVKMLSSISNADCQGLYVGSKEIVFIPGEVSGGEFSFDVGTAGSLSLLIQAATPISVVLRSPLILRLRGGTDVKMAPLMDYMRFVFSENLKLLGVRCEIELHRRGHYPRGGGLVTLKLFPSKVHEIDHVEFRGRAKMVHGVAHAVKLPHHVVERIAQSAEKTLRSEGIAAEVKRIWSQNGHLGPGAGIVIWMKDETVIGADSLGEKGKPSEVVGKEAASKLLAELKSGMAFDRHMGDMILPYLAIAGGGKVGVSELSMHAKSNMWLCERILKTEFRVEGGLGKPSVVEVVR